MITQKMVGDIYEYCAEDGALIWKIKTGRKAVVGRTAGSIDSEGYLSVNIKGKSYYVHRVVWLLHHGYFHEGDVDHIDRNKLNNRIENLREASRSCNSRNSSQRKDNKSGIRGISWHRKAEKWCAQIVENGKNIYLGTYSCFTEAVAHRLFAEQTLNWSGCDSSSPARKHMKEYLKEAAKC